MATRAAGDNEGDAVMGRGLSDLQKTILGLALENHDNHDGVDGAKGVDVIYSEILVKHFGWKGNTRDRYGKRIYSFTVFDRAAIGAKAYASAEAAVSRAVLRLQQRGLAVAIHGIVRWAGQT